MSEEKSPYQTGREYALRRLGRMECSSGDIRSKLILRGIPQETANQIVADLVHAELISDERFARLFVRLQVCRGKGPHVIRQKLREKGLDLDLSEITALSVEVSETTEVETARQLVERKYPNSGSDRAVFARAFQALLRRGFSYSVAKEVLPFKRNWEK